MNVPCSSFDFAIDQIENLALVFPQWKAETQLAKEGFYALVFQKASRLMSKGEAGIVCIAREEEQSCLLSRFYT